MILHPQLAESVRKAWIADQEHPGRGSAKRAYPNQDHLARVLDIAFRASLLKEEGNPIQGSLVLLSPDELETLLIPPQSKESERIIRFSEKRPFDVEVVAKLALATEAGSSSILVGWFNDALKIWGIIYYPKPPFPLSDTPAYIREGRYATPDFPTIEIIGPGSLRVTRSGAVIGRIERGEFKPAVPTPFISYAMGQHLCTLFGLTPKGRGLANELENCRWFIIRDCLEYLIFTIDKQGGGATIIFVPDDSSGSAYENAQFPLECEGSLGIDRLIEGHIHYKNQTEANSSLLAVATEKALRERLDSIIRLASLDGAVLLKPNFDLIGFGVKLDAPPFGGQVQEGQDGFGTSHGLMDFKQRLGTRHNSALRFVAAIPGSVGFVASEDGPIRGLLKVTENEDVTCWPDCRLSMFA